MRRMIVRISKDGQVKHEMQGFSDNQCFSVADKVKAGAARYIKESGNEIISTGADCNPEEVKQLNLN